MTGSDPQDDVRRRFEQEAGRQLRQGAEDLDARTLARLRQAREQALAELGQQRRRPAWFAGWQPALGAAAVAGLAVALWLGRETAAPPPAATAGAEPALELEALLADENLELIEELEFYDWLAMADGAHDAAP